MRFKRALSVALSLGLVTALSPLAGVTSAVALDVDESQVGHGYGISPTTCYKELYNNLFNRFASYGYDGSMSNMTDAAALALGLAGASGSECNYVDVESIKDSLLKDKANDVLVSGRLGKYLTMLAAAGVGNEGLCELFGEDIVGEFESLVENESSITGYDGVWIFAALASYSQNQALIEKTVDAVAACQNAKGMIGGYGYFDYETTAQAAYLLSYASRVKDGDSSWVGKVDAVREKAVNSLLASQNLDGGWSYMGGNSDVDTTGWALCALEASGYSDSLRTAKGATPMSFLLGAADEDNSHFSEVSAANEPMTAAAAFLGLSAYANCGTFKYDDSNVTSPSVQFTGKDATANPRVIVGSVLLYDGVDYTVERNVAPSKSVGTYDICISSSSEYGGTFDGVVYTTYTITPAKCTSVTASSSKGRVLKVNWTDKLGKSAGVSKYKITVKYGSKTVATKTIAAKTAKTKSSTKKTCSFKVSSSKYVGKKLSVAVQAVKTVKSKAIASPSSKAVSVKLR